MHWYIHTNVIHRYFHQQYIHTHVLSSKFKWQPVIEIEEWPWQWYISNIECTKYIVLLSICVLCHRYIHTNVISSKFNAPIHLHRCYAPIRSCVSSQNFKQKPHNEQTCKIEFKATTSVKSWIFIYINLTMIVPMSHAVHTICSITVRLHQQQIICTRRRGVSGPRRIPQSSSQHFAICRMSASNVIVIHHRP